MGPDTLHLPIFCAIAQCLSIYVLSVATVVNTKFTQSVYLYVYTTALPPGGPCPTLRVWPQNCAGMAYGREPPTTYCFKAGDNIKMLCLD